MNRTQLKCAGLFGEIYQEANEMSQSANKSEKKYRGNGNFHSGLICQAKQNKRLLVRI